MSLAVNLARLGRDLAGAAGVLLLMMNVSGCATESSHAVQSPQVGIAGTPYRGARSSVVVGKFDNRSSYMRGLFSDGVDRLGSQAKTILIGHLQQTGRFNVLDRTNMDEIKEEAESGPRNNRPGNVTPGQNQH